VKAAFTHSDPKSAKKTVKVAVLFYAFVTYDGKSCTLNVDENDTCCHPHPHPPYFFFSFLFVLPWKLIQLFCLKKFGLKLF